MLQKPTPIMVVDRFPALLDALLDLLAGLEDRDWRRPVHAGGWTVKDLSQHLLGDEINILSGKRDRFTEEISPPGSWEELVAMINHRNAVWVEATRRMSPRVICDLLRSTGEQVNTYFRQVDLYATGRPVSWAGPEPAPVWLDVAREYTERWHHQQHIRAAVEKPGRAEAYFLTPVLETFAFALPQTFRAVDAPEGTTITLAVSGEAGGAWSVVREQGSWQLYRGKSEGAQAEVELPADIAWQLFTKGLTKEAARRQAKLSGDLHLGEKMLETVAIIAQK
jgi:uncharacterized protein (TIGR03083 family)